MKKLSNNEAELKKSVAYKKACNFKTVLLQMTIHILNSKTILHDQVCGIFDY